MLLHDSHQLMFDQYSDQHYQLVEGCVWEKGNKLEISALLLPLAVHLNCLALQMMTLGIEQ